MRKHISLFWLRVERLPDAALEFAPGALLVAGGIVTVLLGASR